jgi:phage-related protein
MLTAKEVAEKQKELANLDEEVFDDQIKNIEKLILQAIKYPDCEHVIVDGSLLNNRARHFLTSIDYDLVEIEDFRVLISWGYFK